tara:strand:- start:2051 stop:2584 length:534 start_codon:yes stop_codon:yes gene_type:complete
MALIGVVALCCVSSSASIGGFFGGLIPGTEPHFLKVTQADKMKEFVEGFVKSTKEGKEKLEKFPEPGPDMSGLNAEERIEYLEIARKHMQDFHDGELCKVVKENTNTEGKFNGKSALTKYSTNVFTLNGSKNKNVIFEQYVGIGPGPDQISNGKLPETIGMCVASDEDFEKYMKMFK